MRRLCCLWLILLLSPSCFALGEKSWLTENAHNNVVLTDKKVVAELIIDNHDFPGVLRAARNLQSDIAKVTGQTLPLNHQPNGKNIQAVIIGTLGKSQLIDQLVAAKKVDVSNIRNQWDAYQIQVVEQPLPQVQRALVIIGANKRGTTYGIYSLSEQIGVSPWYWWADVPIAKKEKLIIDNKTHIVDMPKVKYRGIFLNDEAPALSNWVAEKYGNYNHKFYENVFELLLRLKANFLWPAMWNNAFADDDPQNMILADEYGIVMSTSHHEPMMRADKEWNRYGKGPWEYSKNPENLYNFWVDGVKRNKPYESIYTLGMRGQQDEPMSEGENIGLLEKIVRDQREILTNQFGKNQLTQVPQVWALYKEVQGFYERGMRVPDDVILLWCDDNWGNIRRLPSPEERKRAGGAGVYYHFDYVGGPRSYRWINTVSIAKIWEQMHLAYTYEANKIWIVNVGDLKPMEYPIEFFLRMAWNPEAWPKERIPDFAELWAEREFGNAFAKEIADIMTGYTRHNLRRKPELQDATIYSQLHYAEADRITAEIQSYATRAEKIYAQLPKEKRNAFYQLVLFPTKASATITSLYDTQAKNHLYAQQARATTNTYAEKVRELFAADAALEREYHALNGGKWNHFMSQPHIGYSNWNNPPEDTLPVVHIYEPHSAEEMGIAVEGMASAWPSAGNYQLGRFDPFGKQSRTLTIFNKGKKSFKALAQTSHPWIIINHTSVQVDTEAQLHVSIDWSKLPQGEHTGRIQITGTGWGGASIGVSAFNPGIKTTALKGKGFVEADGVVAIEAEHFQRQNTVTLDDGRTLRWEKIPQHGRTLSSLSVYPITDHHFANASDAPYVEYDFFTLDKTDLNIDGVFAPSWPMLPGQELRYAIAIDDETPQVVSLTADMSNATWEETVRTDVRVTRSTHKAITAGAHTLRIYSLDPGVTLQKIVIDTGGLLPSYLGPEENRRY
ncbi:glycosyl hydrolase 115 family protein [Cellvibrio sp. pealriver]|uniref:glycosyl hydrolase 115 family protein n=1 Tax=Cellvibrio sp. pealriver TaxID=1622269 RepID=UPI00066FD50D|nr:glycosyl hydrolase 115 family protein [Cellvibrio sp. pealriver]